MPTLKVMTWNVENLFLPDADATDQVRERFASKLANLAAVIDQEQPDLLALQEVGPDGALETLQEALGHPMPHALEGQPDGRGIRVAFLSTLPFAHTAQIQPFPELILPVQSMDPIFDDASTPEDDSLTSQMGRGALEVTVEVEGIPVTVLTTHFKSKLISYARQQGLVGGSQFQPNDEGERYRYAAYALYRRTGEAVTIRDRVNKILAPQDGSPEPEDGLGRQKAVLVCGDLNDEVEAATTQILQGPAGSEIGTGGFPQGDKGDGYRLWNLASVLNRTADGQPPAEPPFTRIFQGRREVIDHIFASHRLVNPDNLPEARTVLATPQLPSVNEIPSQRRGDPASDHAAVLAMFQL